MGTSLLPELHRQWQWPAPTLIFHPTGSGPRVYQRLAHLKIEIPLTRILGKDRVHVGLLNGDPDTEKSDAPVALVCEFSQPLTPEHLNQVRKLAWNFCRTPLLITLEPHLLRAWSCYEKPEAKTGNFPKGPILSCDKNLASLDDALHWSHLASGQFLDQYAFHFGHSQRADVLLLENLRYVRERLTRTIGGKAGLSEGTAHDLLARVLFVQFLFDRTDPNGRAALNTEVLAQLYRTGVLACTHNDLPSILMNKDDTFALFRWLNSRFNGDLFPEDYGVEEQEVKRSHLQVLADFVNGRLQMENGQYLLWRHYCFDTIPLEFISSIYEEFATKRNDGEKGTGEHYTRPFLVDFMLDKVLPWSGRNYDLKILDPCCGSAVFLVKSFQRLIQRWRNAHPNQNPPAALLRGLLENNLFGVDTNPNAIRVASFSLYLAMCDEIDPRHYWTQVRFPSLREKTICTADFFAEDVPGIRTGEDAKRYDLVVGNAPWGKDSLTADAKAWAANRNNGPWPIVGNQTGTLFLPKAARLCRTAGSICMIQPAGSLLFNISAPAKEFRQKLFSKFTVDEIVNLSALRFLNIFPKAVGPACIIKLRSADPNGEAIAYWSPKQANNHDGQIRVVMDEQDLNWLWPEEAANEAIVWPVMTWGSRRDLLLIRYLNDSFPTISRFVKRPSERGFERCKKRVKEYPDRLGYHVLESHNTWRRLPVVTAASRFPKNESQCFYLPKRMEVFQLPIAIMKLSWTVQQARFKAVAVLRGKNDFLLFSQSFFGLHAKTEERLAVFTACANSLFSVYYLHLTSGRIASYRPSVRCIELKALPIPKKSTLSLCSLQKMSLEQIDETVFDFYGLSEVHRAMIEDFCHVTLQGCATTGIPSCGTVAWKAHRSTSLETYSDWVLRVLQSGFGVGRGACATIFRTPNPTGGVLCMVAIHLDWERAERIQYEDVVDSNLLSALKQHMLDGAKTTETVAMEGIYYRRVSRIYQTVAVNERGKKRNIPTVFLIKPNQVRYWTRSVALRDADNIVAEIMQLGSPGPFAVEASLE